MLRHDWPRAGPGEPADLRELRGAIVRRDVPDILGAIEGREVDDLLQHVGMGVQVLLSAGAAGGDVLGLSVVNRLDERGWVGDDILAEDLLAQLQGTILAARRLPVDLSELASELAGGPDEVAGYLDLQTGEIVPGVLVDPMYGAEDDLVDVESDPDRWLELVPPGSHARWQDMADFAGRQTSTDLRRRLESAIDGKGAFRRFRNVVDEEDLVDGWRRFSEDRDVGRARAYLAGEGIRALPQA
jgi:hypothetical protein